MRTDTELLDALESVARRGACPAVLNDDNGHWACIDEGVQSIGPGPEPADIHSSFCVPADKWHRTLREAVNAYLDEYTADEQSYLQEG